MLVHSMRVLASLWVVLSAISCLANGAEQTAVSLLHAGPGEGESPNQFQVWMETQMQLLKSPYVLNAALRDPAIANLEMLKSNAIKSLEAKTKQISLEISRLEIGAKSPGRISLIQPAIIPDPN